MHELPNLTRLSLEEKDALILAQFEQIDRLTMSVQTFGARVRELERRLRKDSHNSSKPPASDCHQHGRAGAGVRQHFCRAALA